MIYFADDDVYAMRPFHTAFELEGREVKSLRNADEAFDELANASDVELVVLDVMLGTRDKERSRFRNDGAGFMETGLDLLDQLCEANPKYFPSRVVVFSMADDPALISRIKEKCEKKGVPYLKKADYRDAYEFVEDVMPRMPK